MQKLLEGGLLPENPELDLRGVNRVARKWQTLSLQRGGQGEVDAKAWLKEVPPTKN
jgi:hypothetical protein